MAGTSGKDSYEECLQTKFKHSTLQVALKLILVGPYNFGYGHGIFGDLNQTSSRSRCISIDCIFTSIFAIDNIQYSFRCVCACCDPVQVT